MDESTVRIIGAADFEALATLVIYSRFYAGATDLKFLCGNKAAREAHIS
jgi:hypothetical protein